MRRTPTKQKAGLSSSHKQLDRIEHVVVKATPYVMVALALLLVAEFTIDTHSYEPWVTLLDWWIIAFFVVDLSFKYAHTRNVLTFAKLYWLELLAVFPFYLLFRVFAAFGTVGEVVTDAQKFAHEAALARESEIVSKEAKVLRETRLLRDVELFGREAGASGRILRFSQRLLRLVAARLKLGYTALVHHGQTHQK